MSRVCITEHAVEQFISRHHRDMDGRTARVELRRMVVTAQRLDTRTLAGDEIWLDDDVEMVVRWDGRIRAHVMVTVLPPKSYEGERMRSRDCDAEIRREAEIDREEHRKKIEAERAAAGAAELERVKTDPRAAAALAQRKRAGHERIEHARGILRHRFSGKMSQRAVRRAESVFEELGLPMPSPIDDGE